MVETVYREEWLRPHSWVVLLKDEINKYTFYERVLIEQVKEQEAYRRGESLMTGEEYLKSIETYEKANKILNSKEKYIDDLFGLLNNTDIVEDSVVMDYLYEPELSLREIGDRYGYTQDEVQSLLRSLKRTLDGEVGYTNIKSGSLGMLRDKAGEYPLSQR